jgi:hypothetical protein
VAMEVRYLIFTPEETRSAITAFVRKQGQVATANDIMAIEVVGSNDAPAAVVRLQPLLAAEPIRLSAHYLVAALLLYCVDRLIPIPRQAEKKVELSVNGLTLVLTSDRSQGSPVLANNQVTYGELANRATRKIGTIQEELARAIARADYAESLVARADRRVRKAEAARARSTALLNGVASVPGLRGWLGRWLVKFKSAALSDCD